jgi:MtaA/CmuA family methyltransferase
MAKQMLLDATMGKSTEMAPWLPYAGVNCAFLIKEKADEYYRSPELMARGVVESARRYHADGIPLSFDLSLEAESVGCELAYWEDNVPSVMSHPCEKQTPAELGMKMPTRDSGRWPVMFEAAKIAKPQLDELDCAMVGLVTGPLTLGSHIAGTRIFTALLKNKEFAHEAIKYASEVMAVATKFYVEMGCDIIALVDPVASQIKPATFREFVSPYCREAIDVIHEANRVSSFFICGDCTKVAEEVCLIGTHGFAVDEQMNMNFIRELARKHKKGFGGNLKLTLALSMALISPREDALISLSAGGTDGFVLSPGCDIPYDTPEENILMAYEARQFYNEYYPKNRVP